MKTRITHTHVFDVCGPEDLAEALEFWRTHPDFQVRASTPIFPTEKSPRFVVTFTQEST